MMRSLAFVVCATSLFVACTALVTQLRTNRAPLSQTDFDEVAVTKNTRRNFFMQVSAGMALLAPSIAFSDDADPCAAQEKVVEEMIANQEKEIIEEIKREEKDENKAEKDAGKLIADLQKQAETEPPRPQIKETKMTLSTQKNQLSQAQKLIDMETVDLIDQLEAEEEQIEEETMALMRKVETLEAAAERLNRPLLPEPDAATPEEAVMKSQKETLEFLGKLKKRATEKEEFINLLKQESTAYAKGGDKKLPEFLEKLRKASDEDKEFGLSLNTFRERLQARFQQK